jgi:hypothetical protein
MSALGQKQTLQGVRVMSALPPKADIAASSMSSSVRRIKGSSPQAINDQARKSPRGDEK